MASNKEARNVVWAQSGGNSGSAAVEKCSKDVVDDGIVVGNDRTLGVGLKVTVDGKKENRLNAPRRCDRTLEV